MTERETTDLDVTATNTPHLSETGPDSGPEHRTDRIDPTATGVDVRAVEHEIEGWGGSSMPEHELTDEQVRHLQDRPEPIGAGETGRALHGDKATPTPPGRPMRRRPGSPTPASATAGTMPERPDRLLEPGDEADPAQGLPHQ